MFRADAEAHGAGYATSVDEDADGGWESAEGAADRKERKRRPVGMRNSSANEVNRTKIVTIVRGL